MALENVNLPPVEETLDNQETYLTRRWNNENVLHVYPLTFNAKTGEETDSGTGSIAGIVEKLDFIKDTGFTAIWLGPIYKSPGKDAGYDISDYREIDPKLGTNEDVDKLIAEAHQRDIRLIFDIVPNHTSDQSEWFKVSSDPSHPEYEKYKDYYIWADPKEGQLPANIVDDIRRDDDGNIDPTHLRLKDLPDGYTVPNNWSSIFSLPQIDKVRAEHGLTKDEPIPDDIEVPAVTAWVWNKQRQQFYLAEFLKEQPSLNWANPAVREEMKDVVRFWLDKGVDGFRIDVMNHIGKDPALTDEVPAPTGNEIGLYQKGITNPHDQWKQEKLVSYWPTLEPYVKDFVSVLGERPGRNPRMIFENWMEALDHKEGESLDEINPGTANTFNFGMLLNTDREHWQTSNIGRIITDYYNRMDGLNGAVPNQVSGNHDFPTLRTRMGSEEAARSAYLLLASQPGMLYTWQGDLLMKPNSKFVTPEAEARERDAKTGQRDGTRTPMQWDNSKNAGFSNADYDDLWLPSVDPKYYETDNIESMKSDPRSSYRFVQAMLARRNSDAALRDGNIRILHTDNPNVLAFARDDPTNPRRQVICLTNFSADTAEVNILDANQANGRVSLSSSRTRLEDEGIEIDLNRKITLSADTAFLIDPMP